MIGFFNTLISTISIAIPAFVATILAMFINYVIIKLFVNMVENIIFRLSGKTLLADEVDKQLGSLLASSVAVSIEAMVILIFIL